MEQCSFLLPSAFSDVSCSVVIFPVSLVDVHCISNTDADVFRTLAFSDVSCSVVIFPVSLVDVHCISNTTACTVQVDKPQTERPA